MIELKISKYCKTLVPKDQVKKASKAMLKKYNALHMNKKIAFESQIDQRLKENNV